jgi:hypothetical protein
VKRKLAWIAVLILFVGCPAAWLWSLNDDRINQSAYDQVRLGMTIREVRDTLGSPGNDLSEWNKNDSKKNAVAREVTNMPSEGTWEHKPDDNEPRRRWAWSGQNGTIVIRLGPDDRVTDKMLIRLKPLGPVERARAMIGW